MFSFTLLAAILTGAQIAPAAAQTPTAAMQPSPAQPTERPGDVYKRLLRPLDQVRSSLDNWSQPELAALAAGIKQAQQYCARVAPTDVIGDDLYQLARVCSFGQQWSAADVAAGMYIKNASPPWQAHAYAIRVNALLNLKDSTMAIEVARSMLRALPYEATVDQSLAFLVHYLAVSLDDAALPLARERQPALLAALKSGHELKEDNGDAVVGPASLYDEGLQLAYLARYAGRDEEAAQSLSTLDAAVSAVPSAQMDNPAEVARARRQYALLGQRLPAIHLLAYPSSPARRPQIRHDLAHDFGTATVLLLFPEWCTQCVAMMQPLTAFAVRNGGSNIHAWGLLALDPVQDAAGLWKPDPLKPDPLKSVEASPALLLTPAETLDQFGVSSLPFAVIVDGKGTIRFLGELPLKAFDPDGFLEQMIGRVVTGAPGGSTAPPAMFQRVP